MKTALMKALRWNNVPSLSVFDKLIDIYKISLEDYNLDMYEMLADNNLSCRVNVSPKHPSKCYENGSNDSA